MTLSMILCRLSHFIVINSTVFYCYRLFTVQLRCKLTLLDIIIIIIIIIKHKLRGIGPSCNFRYRLQFFEAPSTIFLWPIPLRLYCLVSDKCTRMWTTCPELSHDCQTVENRTCNFSIASTLLTVRL